EAAGGYHEEAADTTGARHHAAKTAAARPMSDARRSLPSVSSLLDSDGVRALLDRSPRAVVVDAIRRTIDAARATPDGAPLSDHAWIDAIAAAVASAERPSLRRVINATGVVLHTNLGRAPLAAAAIDAVARTAAGFTNLEYDVA